MLYSDSLREMMQNGLNESFWDGLGVEIGACANFDPKTLFWGTAKNYGDWMRGDTRMPGKAGGDMGPWLTLDFLGLPR